MQLRLLIADSDPNTDDQCRRDWSMMGISLQTARGGVDCLRALRHDPPDVLVLALDLPWGGGDGVLAIMREDPRLRRIPVVVLESGACDGSLWEGCPDNVVARVAKPFDVAASLDRLLAAAGSREMSPALTACSRVSASGRRRSPSALSSQFAVVN